jgi:hypothetical protein
MKSLAVFVALIMVSSGSWSEFSCPTGSDLACLNVDDTVCPLSAKCVDDGATCFDEYPCEPGESFVCESQYDKAMVECNMAVKQHAQLASENTELRVKRLEQKNCVLNASTLEVAKACVRSR